MVEDLLIYRIAAISIKTHQNEAGVGFCKFNMKKGNFLTGWTYMESLI